jgi:hypothetical protein
MLEKLGIGEVYDKLAPIKYSYELCGKITEEASALTGLPVGTPVAGGMFDINFTMFLIASTISRGMRFFLIGWLIWRYGQPIKVFIDKYFNLLATLFTVLLIGFFALAVSIFDGDDEQSAESIETNTEVITE